MSSATGPGEIPASRSVSVLIPAYGAADALQLCLDSLAKHAPAECTITVLDDGTPDTSVERAYQAAQDRIVRLGYYRSDVNRGFVSICNLGRQYFHQPGSDLLLLNSDTEVTAGFLEEMQAVLHLHERHAVVTPRSNNATIFSVPWVGGALPEKDSFELWKRLREMLPRYQMVPTAVGFCMLIKEEVLNRFSLFDEIYSPGYNEENDFVCRINRFGYSAVAANWAYVFHHSGSSFGQRQVELESANSKKLATRYPEYERKVKDYIRYSLDPIETFASLYVPHKPRMLFDLRDLQPIRYGTSEVALKLLYELRGCIGEDIDLYVGVGDCYTFFAEELEGFRTYDNRSDSSMVFDLAFRPFQIFTWSEFQKLNQVSPRVSYLLHDIIMVRCDYLNSAERQILFRQAAELADRVITISEYSRMDFERFYGINLPMTMIHSGTSFNLEGGELQRGAYVLIMGNSYAHKGIGEAVGQLRGSPWPVVVLGGDPDEATDQNCRWFKSGDLSPQHLHDLLMGARLLVYPSHYEGFGLPVVDALALGKPVVVLDTEINRELASLGGSRNLHRIKSIHELGAAVDRVFDSEVTRPESPPRSWAQVAQEYANVFRESLSQPVNVTKLRKRWDVIRTVESACPW